MSSAIARLKATRATLWVLLVLCFAKPLTAPAAEEASQSFIFEGRAYNTNDTPLTDSAVDFNFKIFNPDKSCILYEEFHSDVNLNTTSGLFALDIGSKVSGSTKRTGNDPGLTMSQVFQNSSVVAGKTAAGATCTYTPVAGDRRVLVSTMTPSTGGAETLPDIPLASVPQAFVAETLQGILPTGFVQVSGNVTQANMTTLTGGGDASALHSHDSYNDSRYARVNTSSSQNFGSSNLYTTGSVGIGTTSPNEDLEIKSSNPGIRLTATGGGTSQIDFYSDTGSTVRSSIRGSDSTNTLTFFTSGSQALSMDASQNASFAASVTLTGTLGLGKYTTAQEGDSGTSGTLIYSLNALGASAKGIMWANTTTNTIRYWDGSAAQSVASTSNALLLSGGTMSGNIAMGSNKVTGLAEPTASGDAATKNYVDTQISNTNYLLKSGGTMTGGLQVRASTTTAGTAPIKLPTGVLMTTPEAGAIEYDGTSLYYTDSGAIRRTIFTGAGADNLGNHIATEALKMAGFSINGNSTSGGDLTLDSTSHATKGDIILNPTGGGVGIGVATPTAALELKAGTATVAPLKLTTGTSLSTPESGAIEYDGTNLYFTDSGPTRRTLATTSGLASFLPLSGGTMSGAIAMGTSKITGLGDPTAAQDAATRSYVTTLVGSYLPLTGGAMTGTTTFTTPDGLNSTSPIFTVTNNDITSGQGMGALIKAGNDSGDYPLKVQKRDATEIFVVRGDGNVGIGTANPSATLDVAGTLEIKNGATAQNMYIYNTYTDASNYERAEIGWTGNTLKIAPRKAGTGAIRDVFLDTPGTLRLGTTAIYGGNSGKIWITPNNLSAWEFSGSGHFLAETDNLFDIGATGANRPRNINSAGNLLVAGNAGIGTTSPSAQLSVQGSANGVDVSGSSTGNAPTIRAVGSDTDVNLLLSGKTGAAVQGSVVVGSTDGYAKVQSDRGYFNFLVNDSSGYGGMGVRTNGGEAFLELITSGGTAIAPTTISNSGSIGSIYFAAYDGTNYVSRAQINAQVNGAVATGNVPMDLRFSTGSTSKIERMRIASDGNVGIGTTSPTSVLHLKAGTATANTAPLKLTVGVNLTTPEAGAIEYDGTNLYFTDNGANRRTIATTTGLAGYLPLAGGALTGATTLTTADGLNSTSPIFSVTNNDVTSGQGMGALIKAGNDSGDYPLKVQKRDATEIFAVRGDGNVGIGTASPSSRFHIYGATAEPDITIQSGIDDDGGINFDQNRTTSDAGVGIIRFKWNGNIVAKFGARSGADTTNKDEGALTFDTRDDGDANTEERMRIDKSGNVGIGTASPTGKLHVSGVQDDFALFERDGGKMEYRLYTYSDTAGNEPQLIFGHARGTLAAPTSSQLNDELGSVFFNGYNAAAPAFRKAAQIMVYADEEHGTAADASDSPARIEFGTTADGTNSPVTHMTIKSTGNIGIGTTTPTKKLDIAGGGMRVSAATYDSFTSTDYYNPVSTYVPDDAFIMTASTVAAKATLRVDSAHSATTDRYVFHVTRATTNSLLAVNVSGDVGVQNSAPDTDFEVTGGLCVSDATGDNCATTAGEIRADGAITANAFDLAERYPSYHELAPGTIVTLDPKQSLYVKPGSSQDERVIGIISTEPGLVLGWEQNEVFAGAPAVSLVALAGRVPVLVNGEGGPIRIGDRVSLSSSEPGIGRNAQGSLTPAVGIAMESFRPKHPRDTGKILVFVENQDTETIRNSQKLNSHSEKIMDLEAKVSALESELSQLKSFLCAKDANLCNKAR